MESRLYRRLYRFARRIPQVEARSRAIDKLRDGFMRGGKDPGSGLESALSFLRMSVPKRFWPEPEIGDKGGRYVYIEGKLVRVEDAAKAKGRSPLKDLGAVSSDDLRRHRALTERMQFRGPTWENRR
ncbi:hypothetical protein NDN08_008312 [Rhodosorus marinus]|uniref:Uncharacterized protein n=1 Tax=Rhodosorus marinus TaxID=101924 RepID=A0AAV8V2V4_9RHOD|nr:hypothetical protein NDN08_008312 [Rhodosorus marinus]